MAVLIECISVILKVESIQNKYPGAWEQFRDDVPNDTLCADNELARIGFMTPTDVEKYIHFLVSQGIVFNKDGKAVEIAVVDQQKGFTITCDWAEFGKINWDGNPKQVISACRLVGSECNQVVTPDGWTFENSLSNNFDFCESDKVDAELELIGKDGSNTVYREKKTGKVVYTGGTNDTSITEQSFSLYDACTLLAKAYNNLDVSFIELKITDDIRYETQWVLQPIMGRRDFIDYLTTKFQTINSTGSKVYAELATYRGKHEYCLVLAQDNKENLKGTILMRVRDEKISDIDLCMIPTPEECKRLGIYPT